MRNKIQIKICFRAGHRLIEPYKGKCNNVHGEGFTAIIQLTSKCLNANGMVADFGSIKRLFSNWIDTYLDHAYIYHKDDKVGKYLKKDGYKTFMMMCNPTSENISKLLFENFNLFLVKFDGNIKVDKVSIVESFEDSIAWYEE